MGIRKWKLTYRTKDLIFLKAFFTENKRGLIQLQNITLQSLSTKRQVLGQILVCSSGCCCGQTNKEVPAIPVDWLKKSWKEAGLLRSIQLTITGCLGPCDLTNDLNFNP